MGFVLGEGGLDRGEDLVGVGDWEEGRAVYTPTSKAGCRRIESTPVRCSGCSLTEQLAENQSTGSCGEPCLQTMPLDSGELRELKNRALNPREVQSGWK